MNCSACDYANIEGARFCAKCGVLMPLDQGPSDDPLIGAVLEGRYRIVRLLGEGGMGRVYVAEQQMGTAVRRVAVKTLLTEFSQDVQVQGRFNRECGTVVGLEHPNTITFYDFGKTPSGDLYIAMEFVDGKPLADVIINDGRMPAPRVDHIMKQICGSLHEAHEKGIIHRDLKPENVVLTERAGEVDFVKVLDFGIAKRSDAADQAREQKLTQAGTVLGTPPYMSPEQFTGAELDRRSDIYSLGVMAYEMITGTLPFKANTAWEWATQHMTAQPFPFERTTGEFAAQIPAAMKQAVLRALSKNRDHRQPTTKEFYRELASGQTSSIGATAGGFPATEAFALPQAAQGRPGGTQAGAAFGEGSAQGGYPTPMAGSAPQPYGMGAPHDAQAHGYPTPGPHMVPNGRPAYAPQGGGSKVVVFGALGLLAAGIVGGGLWYTQNHGDDSEPTVPIRVNTSATVSAPPTSANGGTIDGGTPTATADAAPSLAPAGDSSATAEPIADTAPPPPPPTTTTTNTSGRTAPPPPPPPAKNSACDDAIGAAMAGRCGAANAALSRCTGPQQSTAAANVLRCNQKHGGRR